MPPDIKGTLHANSDTSTLPTLSDSSCSSAEVISENDLYCILEKPKSDSDFTFCRDGMHQVGSACGSAFALTISDDCDSDSSHDFRVVVRNSNVLATREKRLHRKKKDRTVTVVNDKRYVGGVRKDVRFSKNNNEIYELVCN